MPHDPVSVFEPVSFFRTLGDSDRRMDSVGGLRSAAEGQLATVPRALAVPPDVPDFPTTAAAPVGLCVHGLAGRLHVVRPAGGASRGGSHPARRSRIVPFGSRLGCGVLGPAPSLGHARIAGIGKGKLGHHSAPRGRVARAATRAYLMRRLIACVFGPPTSGLGLLCREATRGRLRGSGGVMGGHPLVAHGAKIRRAQSAAAAECRNQNRRQHETKREGNHHRVPLSSVRQSLW